MDDGPVTKKCRESLDQTLYKPLREDRSILSDFLQWMKNESFEILHKIEISKEKACARFGVIALQDVSEGEELFVVPRKALLWEKNCSISSTLSSAKFPDCGSGWVKLILCLMLEYKSNSSSWKPYMQFVPAVACMDQPMFWSSREREHLLNGSGLIEAVEKDISSIEKEYLEIALPFIEKHPGLGFKKEVHTLDLYKHMVAFVMAYSFTEPCDEEDAPAIPPVMVPLADVLNHISRNNARLEFSSDCLKMVATRFIKKGEEVYNTYGQLSNAQLLQMYGFVEEDSRNIYDTVDIQLSCFFTVAREKEACWPAVKEKIKWLCDSRGLDESYPISVGKEGVLSVSEFKLVLKVLAMSKQKFREYMKNEDDWDTDNSESSEEEDTESDFDTFSFRKLKKKLSRNEKVLINKASSLRLEKYHVIGEKDLEALESTLEDKRLRHWRIERSRTLIRGQCDLLNLLIEATAE